MIINDRNQPHLLSSRDSARQPAEALAVVPCCRLIVVSTQHLVATRQLKIHSEAFPVRDPWRLQWDSGGPRAAICKQMIHTLILHERVYTCMPMRTGLFFPWC